ncbi:hypothetical protein NEUTE2DRAFT_127629 [Neurospora tetrasperma FGSC 2509]|nr:hypothetical protein NEUTE2DRAFT_127629 [Neurospora tetrasperma FGSC 2509]
MASRQVNLVPFRFGNGHTLGLQAEPSSHPLFVLEFSLTGLTESPKQANGLDLGSVRAMGGHEGIWTTYPGSQAPLVLAFTQFYHPSHVMSGRGKQPLPSTLERELGGSRAGMDVSRGDRQWKMPIAAQPSPALRSLLVTVSHLACLPYVACLLEFARKNNT